MNRSKIKDTAIKRYIRLPKPIRKIADPIIQNREIPKDFLDKRAERGKQWIKNKIMPKKRRKRR